MTEAVHTCCLCFQSLIGESPLWIHNLWTSWTENLEPSDHIQSSVKLLHHHPRLQQPLWFLEDPKQGTDYFLIEINEVRIPYFGIHYCSLKPGPWACAWENLQLLTVNAQSYFTIQLLYCSRELNECAMFFW